MSPDQAPARDPGLQPERTALAWQRTAVAALVLSLVALGAAGHRLVTLSAPAGGPTAPAGVVALTVVATAWAGAAALLAAVDAVVVVPRNVHGLARHPTSGTGASRHQASPGLRLLLMTVTTVLLGLAGALLAAAGLVASVAS